MYARKLLPENAYQKNSARKVYSLRRVGGGLLNGLWKVMETTTARVHEEVIHHDPTHSYLTRLLIVMLRVDVSVSTGLVCACVCMRVHVYCMYSPNPHSDVG